MLPGPLSLTTFLQRSQVIAGPERSERSSVRSTSFHSPSAPGSLFVSPSWDCGTHFGEKGVLSVLVYNLITGKINEKKHFGQQRAQAFPKYVPWAQIEAGATPTTILTIDNKRCHFLFFFAIAYLGSNKLYIIALPPLIGCEEPAHVTGSGRWEWLPPNLVTPQVVKSLHGFQ